MGVTRPIAPIEGWDRSGAPWLCAPCPPPQPDKDTGPGPSPSFPSARKHEHVTVFQVPTGTVVKEGGAVLADLSRPGDEYVAARGGAGGKGNRFFLANDNRAPVTCTPGQPGQERVLLLELKTMAHAGMVGVP